MRERPLRHSWKCPACGWSCSWDKTRVEKNPSMFACKLKAQHVKRCHPHMPSEIFDLRAIISWKLDEKDVDTESHVADVVIYLFSGLLCLCLRVLCVTDKIRRRHWGKKKKKKKINIYFF